MRSIRRTTMLVLALSALVAVVLPTVANASVLKNSEGKVLAKGLPITIATPGRATLGYIGFPERESCKITSMPAELVKNDGVTVELISRGPASFSCLSGNYTKITEIEHTGLALSNNAGTMGAKYTQYYFENVCKYQGSVKVNYTVGTSALRVPTESRIKRLCGGSEGFFYGEFTLSEMLTGKPVLIY